MAMLPFCGYHMGDYFAHWLEDWRSSDASKLPKIFYVNWFRQDENGKFLWPGYGENSRVLKWIFERCDGKVHATGNRRSGGLPDVADLDTKDLNLPALTWPSCSRVDIDGWLAEVPLIKEHFAKFGDRLPKGSAR